MKLVEHYTPTADDIFAMRCIVDMLKENGTWCFPAANLIYLVSKKEHKFQLLNTDSIRLSAHSLAMHERTIIVMRHLGFKVLPDTTTT